MPDQPETPATPAKAIVEVFIAMNEDGDWTFGQDADEATEQLRRDFRGQLCRVVRLWSVIAPPKLVEVYVDVPDETAKVESA